MKLSRTLAPSVVTLLVSGLSVQSALAQGATTSPSAQPGVTSLQPGEPSPALAPAPEQPVMRFDGCHDKWFGMGQTCRDRPWTGPEIMLGADLGVSAMTETGPFGLNKGVGGATQAGPAWGVRAGIELLPCLGLEGRYVGMYNSVQASMSPAGSAGFFTTGGEAVARFTLPIPFVHPYVFGGVGYFNTSLVGAPVARAATPFNSTSEPGVPMGFGFDVPLTWYMSIDAEATYHFLLGESFSAVTTNGIDGGDFSTVNAVLRVRL